MSLDLNFSCTRALTANNIPVYLSRVTFKSLVISEAYWATAHVVLESDESFTPPPPLSLLLAGQRCLQGEPGPGESAYSAIKPQERARSARWKLLVNRSSGNWLAPAGRPSVWTQLSISPLHSSHHHTLPASIFSFIYWSLDKLFSLPLQSSNSLLIRHKNVKHDVSGPPFRPLNQISPLNLNIVTESYFFLPIFCWSFKSLRIFSKKPFNNTGILLNTVSHHHVLQ